MTQTFLKGSRVLQWLYVHRGRIFLKYCQNPHDQAILNHTNHFRAAEIDLGEFFRFLVPQNTCGIVFVSINGDFWLMFS
jgi:hypothetical protein